MASSPSSDNNNSSTSSDYFQLCPTGCGYFGFRATNYMCADCYDDFLNLTQERLQLLAITGKPLNIVKKTTPTAESLDDDHTTSTKKKNRCGCCNKRVGLTGFECRCGGLFCGIHRYPEEHVCFFDYKTCGRLQLDKQNPFCGGDKLPERV